MIKNLSTNEIRNLFLKYFENQGHKILPSSSLVPYGDDSLLFTNAGMVQFKNIFTGIEAGDYPRASTSQKCIRAGGKHNDLENVGYTSRHHTFFEMLGNFSFGDYFKEDAIKFAWDFLTIYLEIPKDKLIVTVYHDDNEAYKLWKKVALLPDEKIIRISTKDNFWEMGDSGPCGPCSEIFYDYGKNYKGGLPGSPEQDDGERYIEIWNLVFMQYERVNGELIHLPKKSVDTGMGLERIAAVCQQKHDNYQIDIFQKIIDKIREITGIKFIEDLNDKNYICARVIADHLRSSAFLISENILPGNNGRNYVLKRIIRRATIYLYKMGYQHSLIYKLVPVLIEVMGDQYESLIKNEKLIEETIKQEEENFFLTIERGFKQFEELLAQLETRKLISGKEAFKLYDTFGLPLDLTKDIAKSHSLEVDIEGFEIEMSKQKEVAKSSWKDVKNLSPEYKDQLLEIYKQHGETKFCGYNTDEIEGTLLVIFKKKSGNQIAIFDQTVCYAESGGQVSDQGMILDYNTQEFLDEIIDVQKYNGLYLHEISPEVNLTIGKKYLLSFDEEIRKQVCANHTATHLLHKALKLELGDNVNQKGSLVNPEKLRFDFNYPKAISKESLEKIEKIINNIISENFQIITEICDKEEAMNSGAMALFGEKYGDKVRVVRIGNRKNYDAGNDFSIELCGGTHVRNTSEIMIFKITSEEAISSGIRRIEAMTKLYAIDFINEEKNNLQKTLEESKMKNLRVQKEYTALLKDHLLKRILSLKHENNFIYYQCENQDPKILREIAMEISRNNNGIYLITNKFENEIYIFLSVDKKLCEQKEANKILAKVAQDLDFNPGGGNKQMSSTTAKKIDLEKLKTLLSKMLV